MNRQILSRNDISDTLLILLLLFLIKLTSIGLNLFRQFHISQNIFVNQDLLIFIIYFFLMMRFVTIKNFYHNNFPSKKCSIPDGV